MLLLLWLENVSKLTEGAIGVTPAMLPREQVKTPMAHRHTGKSSPRSHSPCASSSETEMGDAVAHFGFRPRRSRLGGPGSTGDEDGYPAYSRTHKHGKVEHGGVVLNQRGYAEVGGRA